MKEINWIDFVGETILSVKPQGVNSVIFNFASGNSIEIEVEYFGHSIYGMQLREIQK